VTVQIAVIAKEPRPGRVKTRLCPPFTPGEAARLAEAALVDTLRTVRDTPAARHVVVLDGHPGCWLPPGVDVLPQRSGNLAERLAGAFADCSRDCDDAVVLVGMDTPQLTSASLLHAGSIVEHGREGDRAVIGPAFDGGFWLLALSRPDADAFRDVPMSEATTRARQVRQLRRCGFDITTTETLLDVDTAADAAIVAATSPGSEFAATHRHLTARAPASTG
jgi:uncharacterized protein